MNHFIEITDIPVKAEDGTVIGKARLKADERNNVTVEMKLNSYVGLELGKFVEAGSVKAFSFGPVTEPAVEKTDAVSAHPPMDQIPPEVLLTPPPVAERRLANQYYGKDRIEVANALARPVDGRLGQEEILNRFGFHKASVEGPNATTPKHADLRREFIGFAAMLDVLLPPGRAKDVMFTELETASMWAHKSIAESAPVSDE